jgi:hypothetical protein
LLCGVATHFVIVSLSGRGNPTTLVAAFGGAWLGTKVHRFIRNAMGGG